MKATTISIIGAMALLLPSAALAAPLAPQTAPAVDTGIEQVRLVCDEFGRCFRARGPRYVQRGYGYNSYGYDRGYRRGYYGGGPQYYGGGPSIGFSFGGGRW